MRASREGNSELVRALGSEGVGVSAVDETGNSALAVAAGAGDGNNEGKTALYLAQQIEPSGKRVQFLKALNSVSSAKP